VIPFRVCAHQLHRHGRLYSGIDGHGGIRYELRLHSTFLNLDYAFNAAVSYFWYLCFPSSVGFTPVQQIELVLSLITIWGGWFNLARCVGYLVPIFYDASIAQASHAQRMHQIQVRMHLFTLPYRSRSPGELNIGILLPLDHALPVLYGSQSAAGQGPHPCAGLSRNDVAETEGHRG